MSYIRGRQRSVGIHRLGLVATLLLLCSYASNAVPAVATAAQPTLRVLVTNDDGVAASGIDAAVQALRKLPNTTVTVVAPLTNESGTAGRTTQGSLLVTNAKTLSGYPAKAVQGYPADTIVWAIDDRGVARRPNLVVSGINFGQNLADAAEQSGTVGAARAALRRGIPALAVSQGIDNGLTPNFALGAAQLVRWVKAHRASLLGPKPARPLPAANLNVPTCQNLRVRGPVHVPQANSAAGYSILIVDCSSRAKNPANDVQAFVEGFAALSPLIPAKQQHPVPTRARQ